MPGILTTAISDDCSKVCALDNRGFLWTWDIRGAASDSRIPSFRLQVANQVAKMKEDAKILFTSARTLAVSVGNILLFIDCDHMLQSDVVFSDFSNPDPDYLISRTGLPYRIACMTSSSNEEVLVGTESGVVVAIGSTGRILRILPTGFTERITALAFVSPFSLIVGTERGRILLLNYDSGSVKSTWKSSQAQSSISSLALDPRGNWFAALVSTCGKINLVSGSTRSLVRVFESKGLPSGVNRCEFARLSSSGLSIIVGGVSTPLTVFPLDLSNLGTTRNQLNLTGLENLSRSRRGEYVSVTSTNNGGEIQILAGSNLALVRKLLAF